MAVGTQMDVVDRPGWVPDGCRSTLAQVLWLNLDRRQDRAAAHQQALVAAGLEDFAERVSAVDGRVVDLASVDTGILAEAGRQQACSPPEFVLGRVLTPGAVGLWLTWHSVLWRIIREAGPGDCFLVVEDDAEYHEGFGPAIFRLMEALDACDSEWDACAVGYIRSKTRLVTIPWAEPILKETEDIDEVLRIPTKLCGATAILVHGADGARSMLEALFPVGPDSQFDLKISVALNSKDCRLHMYAASSPLASAPLSEAGDTDIQSIPEAFWPELKHEASIRHEHGDIIRGACHSERSLELAACEAMQLGAAGTGFARAPGSLGPSEATISVLGSARCYCLCRCRLRSSWPRRRWGGQGSEGRRSGDGGAETPLQTQRFGSQQTCSSLSAEAQQLRVLDKGVPHLRRLHGELALATQQLELSDRSDLCLQNEVARLHFELETALDVRQEVLQCAIRYVPRPMRLESEKLVLLPARLGASADVTHAAASRFVRVKRQILVMGLYHSCTNAMAQELEKRFEVQVVNDWQTSKADEDWKHRVNRCPLQRTLEPDVLTILMVKEPHFWLQSCSRELRNFFEIRALSVKEGHQLQEVAPQGLSDLFGHIEHDCILYSNAVGLWNDTVRSYFDDDVYPPERAAIVRCEDFLFSFHELMDALALRFGLRQRRPDLAPPEPLAERAKGHVECRTRGEALHFYAEPRNQRAAFSEEQLAVVSDCIDSQAVSRLFYDGADAVTSWASHGM
ncbi:unnamed protein product [Polarella glacialis]|uniref:Uncharacterized protein n=1 Tax=Polarella glacialis TaxID=89957 RepID=A0A813D7C8_POLGL|nr:unnamed protein product [Polarella glacialis]CAE8690295.1 unnamed protein product [Polarella glacialis]